MKNKDLWKQDLEAMSIMNNKIDTLYKKIDAQDKMINEQTLEIARLEKAKEILLEDRKKATDLFVEYKQRIDKAIEYIKENDYHYMNEYALERFRNNLLEILGDKE